MKKVNLVIGLVLISAGLFLTSCNSNRLCPAYPPSPRDRADVEQENTQQDYEFIRADEDTETEL